MTAYTIPRTPVNSGNIIYSNGDSFAVAQLGPDKFIMVFQQDSPRHILGSIVDTSSGTPVAGPTQSIIDLSGFGITRNLFGFSLAPLTPNQVVFLWYDDTSNSNETLEVFLLDIDPSNNITLNNAWAIANALFSSSPKYAVVPKNSSEARIFFQTFTPTDWNLALADFSSGFSLTNVIEILNDPNINSDTNYVKFSPIPGTEEGYALISQDNIDYVYRVDSANNWTQLHQPAFTARFSDLVTLSSSKVAVLSDNSLLVSYDSGNTWTRTDFTQNTPNRINIALRIDNNTLLTIKSSNDAFTRNIGVYTYHVGDKIIPNVNGEQLITSGVPGFGAEDNHFFQRNLFLHSPTRMSYWYIDSNQFVCDIFSTV